MMVESAGKTDRCFRTIFKKKGSGMTMPDFKKDHTERMNRLTKNEIEIFFRQAEKWHLSETLRKGGAVIFPHSTIGECGAMTAAAVKACLDSGTEKVIVIGCLHALTDEMDGARKRVAEGGRPEIESLWGIQGPGLSGRREWESEFSLLNFLFLWEYAVKKRGGIAPELVIRYPFLAGGKPQALPGIKDLEASVKDAVVVATMDPFHHGIGYGDRAENSYYPEKGGLDLARKRIRDGLDIFETGDYAAYNRHCVEAKSDGRDVGQILRHIIGPCKTKILGLIADDMHEMYGGIAPTWVAGALIKASKT
jgi:hypothetical protein